MTDTLERDLSKHFDDRLRRLISDSIDTCDRAEMDKDHTVALVLGGLLRGSVTVALAVEMEESEFHAVVGDIFRARQRKLERGMAP